MTKKLLAGLAIIVLVGMLAGSTTINGDRIVHDLTITGTCTGCSSANAVLAVSPGVGIAHFAGSTQTVTSSAVALGGADVSGVLPGAKGGSRVLLDTLTASSSSTLSSTCIGNSSYDQFEFRLVDLLHATNATNMLWRYSTDGGMNYDSSGIYENVNQNWWVGSNNAGSSSTDTSLGIGNVYASDAHYPISGSIYIYAPASTASYKQSVSEFSYRATSVSASIFTKLIGWYRSTTAINAIQFSTSSGGFTSGVIYCYGIAKT